MAEKKVEKTEEVEEKEVNGEGGAFARVNQTQGAYDDSALQDSLAELGRVSIADVKANTPGL